MLSFKGLLYNYTDTNELFINKSLKLIFTNSSSLILDFSYKVIYNILKNMLFGKTFLKQVILHLIQLMILFLKLIYHVLMFTRVFAKSSDLVL